MPTNVRTDAPTPLQDILFYAVPDHAHFYTELVNLLESSGKGASGARCGACCASPLLQSVRPGAVVQHQHLLAHWAAARTLRCCVCAGSAHGTVNVLYSKWDVLALKRLVGGSRAGKMIKAEAGTFMFC